MARSPTPASTSTRTSTRLRASEIGREIDELVEQIDIDGLNVEIGGAALAEFEPPESELIGLAFAIVILILAFGSVLAMGLPIGVALFGVGIGVGIITLLTNVMSIPDFAIDARRDDRPRRRHRLRAVHRHPLSGGHSRAGLDPRRDRRRASTPPVAPCVFAGFTVVISLLGMFVMGLAFINGLATGAAVTVAGHDDRLGHAAAGAARLRRRNASR